MLTALRRRWVVWIAAAGALLAAFVLFWFQPQKLVIDESISEPSPAPAPTTASPTTPSAASEPVPPIETVRGDFVSLDHRTRGRAIVLELADGSRVLRLEGFETDNGPDVFVYLSTNPAGGDEGAFDDDYANLGRLRGNIGDQNYDVPADIDLTRFKSVVIWCDRFNSAFGAADLAA